MKRIALIAAAAMLGAPAFAQSTVTSSTGATVSSGTGVVVAPAMPAAAVTVTPAADVAVANPHLLPGGTMVQHSTTTVMGAAPASQTIVTRYWVNVPAGVERDADFQRWQRLK